MQQDRVLNKSTERLNYQLGPSAQND